MPKVKGSKGQAALQERGKNRACHAWTRGHCRQGDACVYRHDSTVCDAPAASLPRSKPSADKGKKFRELEEAEARVLNRHGQKHRAFEAKKAQECSDAEHSRNLHFAAASIMTKESPHVALKAAIKATHPHLPAPAPHVATPDGEDSSFTIVTGKGKGRGGLVLGRAPTPPTPPALPAPAPVSAPAPAPAPAPVPTPAQAPAQAPFQAPVQAPFDLAVDQVPERDNATLFQKIAWLSVYDMQVYRWAGNEREWTEFALHLHPDVLPLVSAMLSFIASESGCEMSIETERLHGQQCKFLRFVRGGIGEPANDSMEKAMDLLSRLLISRLDAPQKEQTSTPSPLSSPPLSPRAPCAFPAPREGRV